MKHFKKTSIVGAYVRKEDYEYEGTKYEADIRNDDTVTILSSAQIVSGEFGDQKVISIKTRNGDKNMPLNQSSVNVLVEEFGDDDEKWIGKEVKVILKKGMFGGKKGIASYLVTPDWTLDEYGKLVKAVTATQGAVATPVNSPDFDDIDPTA